LQDTGFTSERHLLVGVLGVFLTMGVLASVDIVTDLDEGTTLGHVVTESGILACCLLGILLVARKLLLTVRHGRAATAAAQALAGQLELTTAEAARWRQEAHHLMTGLAEAIDSQFERWQLSPAEKEVALLLLKGLSHREIANARNVTEATARQQARAVYRKAELSGRHDLAAFFLEDLMLPVDDRDASQRG